MQQNYKIRLTDNVVFIGIASNRCLIPFFLERETMAYKRVIKSLISISSLVSGMPFSSLSFSTLPHIWAYSIFMWQNMHRTSPVCSVAHLAHFSKCVNISRNRSTPNQHSASTLLMLLLLLLLALWCNKVSKGAYHAPTSCQFLSFLQRQPKPQKLMEWRKRGETSRPAFIAFSCCSQILLLKFLVSI